VTQGYSLRDVGRLLGLSRSIVYGLIDAGFVSPARGPRREYRFSFQDLVVLRAAQALTEASIPPARIRRSLRRLRSQLPDEIPLAGLRIEAVGDTVVVTTGDAQWQPDTGQYVLQLGVASPGGRLAFLERSRAAGPSVDWFSQALRLEATKPDEACAAYRAAVTADPRHCDAYVNLGRLLHERGRVHEAEVVYRDGIAHCGADGTLLYNLGVLQEDLGQDRAAADSYRKALAAEPNFADAHYNLARLCDAHGLQQEALRHWSAYRKLSV
jgi:tetratricopeptide (TPR) repeat protein